MGHAESVGAIIAAAGLGTRLGKGSKALLQLNGRTALVRSLMPFLAVDEIDKIVVAGPPSQLELAQREVNSLRPAKPVLVCPGGETRQRSVHAALQALEGCEFVLVHDAARPLVSTALVRRVLLAAQQTGAAIPGLGPRDAVKRVEGHRMVESLDRSHLILAQTPQGFRYQVLESAHFQAADAGLVGDDDAQLVASAGHPVTVVPGEAMNIKLTTREDLAILEALLQDREASGAD